MKNKLILVMMLFELIFIGCNADNTKDLNLENDEQKEVIFNDLLEGDLNENNN